MKNFRYSVIIFIAILIASVMSDIYVKNQMLEYKSYLSGITTASDYINDSRISTVKEKFIKQKNMLQLFINKEHINELEKNILLIDNYNNNNSIQENTDIITETLCLISQIRDTVVF